MKSWKLPVIDAFPSAWSDAKKAKADGKRECECFLADQSKKDWLIHISFIPMKWREEGLKKKGERELKISWLSDWELILLS